MTTVSNQSPRSKVLAELLDIANGDIKLVIKAGKWVNGKLYVDRSILVKLVEEQSNVKRNESSDGPGGPAIQPSNQSPTEVSSLMQVLRKLSSLLSGANKPLLTRLVRK